ncbi:MAG: HAD-IA family hydrolase [Nannocystis sp.]|nr:HAD-IA family hydrolase [Nannocystis sp.]MBA3548709.1 HAD-IA family hydrolase [Nannocystis sp.]
MTLAERTCSQGQPARAIVFDLIGVLAAPSWRELCGRPDLAAWGRLKVGAIGEAEFWTPEQAAAYRGALALRSDRLDFLGRLRARGHTISIASNLARGWLPGLRASMPAGLVERWFVSGEIGVAKPDPRFWSELLRHVPAGSLVVDDQRRNCEAAKQAGLRSLWVPCGAGFEDRVEAALAG